MSYERHQTYLSSEREERQVEFHICHWSNAERLILASIERKLKQLGWGDGDFPTMNDRLEMAEWVKLAQAPEPLTFGSTSYLTASLPVTQATL
jgi:hypothetical protein